MIKLVTLLVLGVSDPTLATDEPATPVEATIQAGFDPLDIQFHGFVNQGYSLSDNNSYGASRSSEGSARFFDAGFNLATQLTEELRVGMQLVAFNWDIQPGFSARLDWAFLDYHLRDWVGFRAGRVRQANGLYNQVWDVEAARVAVLLPQAIYTLSFRPNELSMNGAEVYGRFDLGAAGALEYQLQGGVNEAPEVQGVDFKVDWTVIGRLVYETPIDGLRFGASIQTNKFSSTSTFDDATTAGLISAGVVPADFSGTLTYRWHNFYILRAFAELQRGDFLLAAEYQLMNRDGSSNAPGVGPDVLVRPEGMFVLTSYRLTDWFAAGAYVGLQYADALDRTTSRDAAFTLDYALSTRFDVNRYLIVKIEGHYFDGTAVLDPRLNTDPTDQDRKGVFGVARVCLTF